MSKRNIFPDAKRLATVGSAEKRNSLKHGKLQHADTAKSTSMTQESPSSNPQCSLTSDSVYFEEDLAGKGPENKQERNWLCCREDISPDQPLPGISTRSMLPVFCAHMTDQHGPSYRVSAKPTECPSAEQNLRTMREWQEAGNKLKISTAVNIFTHVMNLKKQSHVLFNN